MAGKILWTPSAERASRSQMHAFMHDVAERHGFTAEWEPLRRWSIDKRELFWPELLQYVGIEPSQPAHEVFRGDGMLGGRWFGGMKLNYARHLLRFDDDDDAIIYDSESDNSGRMSHSELRAAVARCAHALREDGVIRGDRVAGFLPNISEALVAMLAAASIGAVWSSCSPDFGVSGVLDRFGQIEPTILVVADGYHYGGKHFDTLPSVSELLRSLPTLRRVVVVPFAHPELSALPETLHCSQGHPALLWDDYLGSDEAPALEFEEVPFDHPLFIMYSSGTTGIPKCIVHGHGGTLLQHMKELILHCDLRPGERCFYFTTCGWMMWNWLASVLGTGAAVVLYEGNPGFPDLGRLWRFADSTRANVFGTSPKFIAACQKGDIHPGRDHDLSELRCVLSTGAPLNDDQFRWIYAEVREDLQLSSISGGTDIISCFMLGNPLLPVHSEEIQCRGLAMDVHAWDDDGRSVVGEKGELVCTAPFPSQPVSFWNDPEGKKYRAAYFDVYPGVWRHGDFVEITDSGGVIVYGRSDATLNPGGVRIGTAEIYRVVEAFPEIVDSIAVGRRAEDDVEIVLFVVMREGASLDAPLEARIRKAIADGATKRHVPRHIRVATAIPCTISGKKVELAVQKMLHGEEVTNRDALANPEVLDQFSTAF